MWLIPSQLSGFVQASDGSTNPSPPAADTSAESIELRPTVNGKPTLRTASWPGWKNRPWSRRLFGAAISDSSTAKRFVDRWTASLRDSRASRGRRPGSSSGRKTTAGSGRLLFGSSVTWNPDSCSWKTSQRSLLGEDLNTSSVTLPKWGSMRSGAVSRRKPLELRTGASGCSSWPTIRAHEVGDYQNQKSGPPVATLTGVAEDCWTTPVATERANRGNRARKDPSTHTGGESNLADDVQHWQTPSGQGHHSRKQVGDDERQPLLPSQAQQWQSPGAMGGGSVSRGGDRVGERLLAGQAEQFVAMAWPSPRARDHKGSGNTTERPDGKSRLDQLDFAAENFSPPVPALTGQESPKPSGRRLNAAFVCWLMGAPWYWTRAEPISCGAEETALWRCKVQLRLLNLCGEP